MARLTSFVLFLGLTTVFAQIPIPNRYDGFASGNGDAPLLVEMFIDPLCPDSKAAWPAIKEVLASYGPDRLRFYLHLFPLPYHRNSFMASQTFHPVADVNSALAFQWADIMFENQDAFSNGATSSLTPPQVIDKLAALGDSVGVAKDKIATALTDPSVDWATRVSWKYACSRGVAGTPSYLVNGVAVNADTNWTLADWKSLLDPLYTAKLTQASHTFCNRAVMNSYRGLVSADTCPSGQEVCKYLPGKTECCTKGESCIPNVGCRC
eukprot:GILJ01004291.1.p1 GENE.GILJ01004291.1~~GILJ01004291.1.p1  ORF type:complete len:266 (-),score=26.78 GILJ01004291.1:164-961(-)